ncbi:MAG: sugar ABC transporter permease [Propionibacteriaceae bacterium]|jgi:multiple sugar transport system permease protein/alpha-1,4-digalacturonate transport system permease protein|nr:sugar ABC transporter permease [Propionibacteriaceae bacterium]
MSTTTPAPVRQTAHRAHKLRRRNTALGWSFIAPNFIGFAVITLVPIILMFYMAFTDWNALGTPHWTGLANFQRLARNSTFRAAVAQTFYYAIPHIILTGVIALALAILLNQKIRGVAFFRAAAFFPYITSIVAIAIVWNLLFSPKYGPVNQFLTWIGVAHPPGWTVSSTWAMPALIIVGTWREMGYYMILFLAGLQTIPRELYEAAKVDGASGWRRFLHITWPGLRPTTFFVTVMLAIQSFKVFDLIQVMTEGGPGTSTYVISFFIFQKSIGVSSNAPGTGEFGYASAASLILFFICLTFTILQFIVNQQSDLRKPRWTPVPLALGLVAFALAVASFASGYSLGLGYLGYLALFVVCFGFLMIHVRILRRRQQ